MKGFSPYVVFYTLHLIGIIFGVGGVLITDVLSIYGFFKPETMREHVKTFKLLSLVIWVGLFILVTTGFILVYISQIDLGGSLASNMYEEPLKSAAYPIMLVLNGVVFLNGLFLNFKVTPAFEKAVAPKNFLETPEYKKAMKLGFVSGTVSFLGWWGIFFICIYLFRIIS